MSGRLENRVCIVTGSTRGIGRAVARRFSDEGACVVINGRTQEECDQVARQMRGPAIAVAADLADSSQVDALVQGCLAEWGSVDILVNNAAIARDGFISRVSDEDWQRVLAVNLSGPFYATRAVTPPMKQQGGGSIINVLSWAGLRGNQGQVAYSASKAGVHGLTLASAKELARFSIRVNALCPVSDTDMTGQMDAAAVARLTARLPLHRLGEPDEIAEAALFLASDASSYTTGQVLHVDGGLHLT
jgi:3-oxoacyl-[acyl-carrier protein] reductase